jgi:uncharacterized protein (DUF433 family)
MLVCQTVAIGIIGFWRNEVYVKYEDEVNYVCGDEWRKMGYQDRDGAYGVACVKAYLKGVRPVLADLATHLSVKPDDIAAAYNRLSKNDVFAPNWDAKHDELLLGESTQEDYDRAWAHIAAIAGGHLGHIWAR